MEKCCADITALHGMGWFVGLRQLWLWWSSPSHSAL